VGFVDLLREKSGVDLLAADDAALARAVAERGMAPESDRGRGRLIDQLFGATVEPYLDEPTFLVDFPIEISPLAKPRRGEPRLAERFELFIGGMEIANAYSELNDPIEQRRRFEAQLDQAQGSRLKAQRRSKTASLQPRASSLERRIDEGFIEALEYGMPPAGGLGVGVDRLAMLLLNQPSIKDVILFPLLKSPLSEGS
jgi:lysyl-tRNA synthetase class 2